MKRVWGCALMLCLASCADRMAGGGPSGTEAGNALTLTARHRDGSAATGALLRLRARDYLPGSSGFRLDSVISDSAGNAHIQGIPDGQYFVEIVHDRGALLIPLDFSGQTKKSADLGERVLREAVVIRGRLPSQAMESRVVIRGLERLAEPDSSGNFAFTGVPAGEYVLQTVGGSWKSRVPLRTQPAETVDVGILRDERRVLLLEDFEDGDNRHRYAALSGGGFWTVESSSNIRLTESSSGIPLTREESCGICLRLRVNADYAVSASWVQITLWLADFGRGMDLSSVDSLALRWRGNSAWLYLWTEGSATAAFTYLLGAQKNWARISVARRDFSSGLDSVKQDLAWKKINAIGIYLTGWGDQEIWMDDLTLTGSDINLF